MNKDLSKFVMMIMSAMIFLSIFMSSNTQM
jgi:hypothetical protein